MGVRRVIHPLGRLFFGRCRRAGLVAFLADDPEPVDPRLDEAGRQDGVVQMPTLWHRENLDVALLALDAALTLRRGPGVRGCPPTRGWPENGGGGFGSGRDPAIGAISPSEAWRRCRAGAWSVSGSRLVLARRRRPVRGRPARPWLERRESHRLLRRGVRRLGLHHRGALHGRHRGAVDPGARQS